MTVSVPRQTQKCRPRRCGSSEREGESNIEAGERRLMEEMGFTTPLRDTISFIYKAPFDNGLTEHEYDHILIGDFNEEPQVNPSEVASCKWVALDDLEKDIRTNPQVYTAWFKIIFEKFYKHILV